MQIEKQESEIEVKSKLRTAFDKIDTDDSGSIDANEVQKLMLQQGINMSNREVIH